MVAEDGKERIGGPMKTIGNILLWAIIIFLFFHEKILEMFK